MVPDSNMPSFKWLFHQLRVPVRKDGDGYVLGEQPELARHFTLAAEPKVRLFPNEAGLAFADPGGRDGKIPGTPVLELRHFGEKPPVFTTITLVVPAPDMVGLVAYVQKLGTNRGAWRDAFEPQTLAVSVMQAPQSLRLLERGREVYHQRCVGCHGEKGDGNGPAAAFLDPRPRNFTVPAFKFRTTPSGSLPTDGDLYRTITRGVRWTAMPTWHELPGEGPPRGPAVHQDVCRRLLEGSRRAADRHPRAAAGLAPARRPGQSAVPVGEVLGVPRERGEG